MHIEAFAGIPSGDMAEPLLNHLILFGLGQV